MNIRYGYRAERKFASLPRVIQERISEKMRFFAEQEDPLVFAKYVTGEKEYRFRIGNYRLRFTISNGTIWITKIEPRDKAYR